jgi:hypothetical protein
MRAEILEKRLKFHPEVDLPFAILCDILRMDSKKNRCRQKFIPGSNWLSGRIAA